MYYTPGYFIAILCVVVALLCCCFSRIFDEIWLPRWDRDCSAHVTLGLADFAALHEYLQTASFISTVIKLHLHLPLMDRKRGCFHSKSPSQAKL